MKRGRILPHNSFAQVGDVIFYSQPGVRELLEGVRELLEGVRELLRPCVYPLKQLAYPRLRTADWNSDQNFDLNIGLKILTIKSMVQEIADKQLKMV